MASWIGLDGNGRQLIRLKEQLNCKTSFVSCLSRGGGVILA